MYNISQTIKIVCLLTILLGIQRNMEAQIAGKVSDIEANPISGAHVLLKNSTKGTQTDSLGNFTINARLNDTLYFSHIGMTTLQKIITNTNTVLAITLQPDPTQLDEVTVTARKYRRSPAQLLADYPEDKNLIKTSWGIVDKEYSSTHMRIIDGNHLFSGGIDFLDGLKAHIPQIEIVREDLNVKVYLQALGTTFRPTAIFEVDGFLSTSPPTHLQASAIERIAVLQRNAALIRYGPQGAGGVIIINTKAQTDMDERSVVRQYDNEALRDSLASLVDQYQPYSPSKAPYLKELENTGLEEAITTYRKIEKKHRRNPYFYLDMYNYFLSRWNTQEITNEIGKTITDNFSDNIPILKALAYIHQEHGYPEKALPQFLKIINLDYSNAQSHRDLANNYVEMNETHKGINGYLQYFSFIRQIKDDSNGTILTDDIIKTETTILLEKYQDTLFESRQDLAFSSLESHTRVLVEWNDPDVSFDLQFIQPSGAISWWANSSLADSSARYATTSREFFINSLEEGQCQINIDFHGKQRQIPLYLKLSVFQNYGLENQSTEQLLYKLQSSHEFVKLVAFEIQ